MRGFGCVWLKWCVFGVFRGLDEILVFGLIFFLCVFLIDVGFLR